MNLLGGRRRKKRVKTTKINPAKIRTKCTKRKIISPELFFFNVALLLRKIAAHIEKTSIN